MSRNSDTQGGAFSNSNGFASGRSNYHSQPNPGGHYGQPNNNNRQYNGNGNRNTNTNSTEMKNNAGFGHRMKGKPRQDPKFSNKYRSTNGSSKDVTINTKNSINSNKNSNKNNYSGNNNNNSYNNKSYTKTNNKISGKTNASSYNNSVAGGVEGNDNVKIQRKTNVKKNMKPQFLPNAALNSKSPFASVISDSKLGTPSMTSSVNPTTLNSFEIKFFGNLLKNPESFGFQKLQHRPHGTPKYMLQENVLFSMETFTKNDWDQNNQQFLVNREQEYSGEPQLLFEEFQDYRKKERSMMEKLNLVDKENTKKSLKDAIIFRGSCEDMCPTYERVERVFKNQVSKWEKDPVTNKISRNLALKTFMRPSGQAPPLPSDVRPPNVLQKTLNHIIENLLPNLPDSQSFIWDRTRSIRQDFTFQNNYSGIESIDCHEKICRIHILSLHVMAGANDPDYQQQQEIEQFNNSLQTLTHMYDDVRSKGGFCPNEPEFRAYELISKIKDAELDRYLQTLPDFIQNDHIVQRAVMLRNLVLDGMNGLNCFTEFFKTVLDQNKTSFLLASMAEIHFNEIRYNAFRSINKVYHSKSKNMPSAQGLVFLLGYNDVNQLLETCKLYSLPTFQDSEAILRVDITALKVGFKFSQKQAYTRQIDNMINGQTMSQIINSGKINTTLNLTKPQSVEQIARESFKEGKQNTDSINQILKNSSQTKIFQSHKSPASELNFQSSVQNQHEIQSQNQNQMLTRNQNIPQNLFLASVSTKDNKVTSFQNDISGETKSLGPDSFVSTSVINKQSAFPSFNKNIEAGFSSQSSRIVEKPERELATDSRTSTELKSPKEKGIESKQIDTIVVPPVNTKPQKKLVDNAYFESSTNKIVDEVIRSYVSEVSENLVEQKLKVEITKRRDNKKSQFIKKLSSDLFNAFMKEQMYLTALEARANCVYRRNLKLCVFKRIIDRSKQALKKKQLRDSKTTEIKQFSTNIPALFAAPKESFKIKIPKIPRLKIEYVTSNIAEIFKKINPLYDLNGTIVIRTPKSVASRWLLNQFGMKTIQDTVDIKDTSGYRLNISTLPDNFTAQEYFKDISTVIIQIGTVEGVDQPTKQSLVKCLTKDAKVLNKLKHYLGQYSRRSCLSIVIVYVDAYATKLSYEEIKKILNLESLLASGFTIGFFKMKVSLLMGERISASEKLHLDFTKLLQITWKKMYLRSNNELTKVSDSINCVGKNPDDFCTANSQVLESGLLKDEMPTLSPLLIRRKLDYLTHVVNSSNSKRRKFSNNMLVNGNEKIAFSMASPNISFRHNYSNNETSDFMKTVQTNGEIKESNNSLMMLWNHKNMSNNFVQSANNSSLRNGNFIDKGKKLQEIEALKELNKLADNVLNS